MKQLGLAVGLGTSILLLAGQAAEAQYQYTDDKGTAKIVQFKLNVPPLYRDGAIWIGPTGLVEPTELSDAQRTSKRIEDANRRIADADAQLAPYLKVDATAAAEAASVEAEQATADRGSRRMPITTSTQRVEDIMMCKGPRDGVPYGSFGRQDTPAWRYRQCAQDIARLRERR
jgi:hypothetical protein